MLRILGGCFWVAHESVVNIITIETVQGASPMSQCFWSVQGHFLCLLSDSDSDALWPAWISTLTDKNCQHF